MSDKGVAAVAAAVGAMKLSYSFHVCAEEAGNGVTQPGEGWKGDLTSGADGAIEPGTRRFLVRLSKPTQTEPIPKHTVDIHLTVSSVVGEEGDLAKMRYSIEQDSMVRRVADDAGTPTVAGDEWLLDRMIATKQAFAAQ